VVLQGSLELSAKGLARLVPRHDAFVDDCRKLGSIEVLVSLLNFTWSDRLLSCLAAR